VIGKMSWDILTKSIQNKIGENKNRQKQMIATFLFTSINNSILYIRHAVIIVNKSANIFKKEAKTKKLNPKSE
jgi:hypothetical protein